MSKRSEQFNRSMRSLDAFVASFGDASKIAVLADRDGRERDGQDARRPSGRVAKLHAAEMRLYRAGRGHLVPVLRLIVRYGSARNFSLEKISRAQYFRHRNALLRFFS